MLNTVYTLIIFIVNTTIIFTDFLGNTLLKGSLKTSYAKAEIFCLKTGSSIALSG